MRAYAKTNWNHQIQGLVWWPHASIDPALVMVRLHVTVRTISGTPGHHFCSDMSWVGRVCTFSWCYSLIHQDMLVRFIRVLAKWRKVERPQPCTCFASCRRCRWREVCNRYTMAGFFTHLEVYSFGMVMFELLTGLAPATADASRREVRGKDFTKKGWVKMLAFVCMCEPHTPKSIHEISWTLWTI